MEHGSAPLSNPSTIVVILSFKVSRETLKNCVKSYQGCGALVGVSVTNKLGDWYGGKLSLRHADSQLDRFDWKTSRHIRGQQQQALLRRIQGKQ